MRSYRDHAAVHELLKKRAAVGQDLGRVRLNVVHRSSAIAPRSFAVNPFEDLDRNAVELQHALGRQQNPFVAGLVKVQSDAAHEGRDAVFFDFVVRRSFRPVLWVISARRDQARRHIGIVKAVELGPQHVALEDERFHHGGLLLGSDRVLLDIVRGEIGISRRLGQRLSK